MSSLWTPAARSSRPPSSATPAPTPSTRTLHLWNATFPVPVTDQLMLGTAQLHIDVMPPRTTIMVDLGDYELGATL